MEQLELFSQRPGRTEEDVVSFLADGFRHPLKIAFTRNRVSMVTVKFHPSGRVDLRMHEAFVHAPHEVLEATKLYIRTRRKSAWERIEDYVATLAPGDSAQRRPVRRRVKGRVYDLEAIKEHVNQHYFEEPVECEITWGRGRASRRKARSICFGTYHQDNNLVRIHPKLDDPRVPREFVEYIVYHEMLHAAVPPVRKGGRTLHHPAIYRVMENRFPNIRKMKKLATKLLHELS